MITVDIDPTCIMVGDQLTLSGRTDDGQPFTRGTYTVRRFIDNSYVAELCGSDWASLDHRSGVVADLERVAAENRSPYGGVRRVVSDHSWAEKRRLNGMQTYHNALDAVASVR